VSIEPVHATAGTTRRDQIMKHYISIKNEDDKKCLDFDLRDILLVLGDEAIQSSWALEGVECHGGYAVADLHSASDEKRILRGESLLALSNAVGQIVEGVFSGFVPPHDRPWIVIRAVDGTAFDIETDRDDVVELMRSRFECVFDEHREDGIETRLIDERSAVFAGHRYTVSQRGVQMRSIEEINRRLAEMDGLGAVLWIYDRPRNRLEIRLERPDDERMLFLVLEACFSLKCPVGWKMKAARIVHDEDSDRLRFTNGDSLVDITCGGACLVEKTDEIPAFEGRGCGCTPKKR